MTRIGADVLVVGGGPAGRALAAACVETGMRVTLVDRAPEAPWRATYGGWADRLPDGVPVAAVARAHAYARTPHDLGREYAVLDTGALRAVMDARTAAVIVRRGRVVGVAPDGVRLADGTTLRARCVVDAGGAAQPLSAARPPAPRAEQTAYGVVVAAADAAPLVPLGTAVFMDWRSAGDGSGPATFLYGVPLGGGVVLLEETSLARRPGLGLAELRARLRTRLRRHGIDPGPDAHGSSGPGGPPVERVRFPLDVPRHRLVDRGVVAFGAAAPLTHPATGYGVLEALRAAPRVAAALAAGGPHAAERVLWPARAAAVHRLRRIGLRALLDLPAADLPEFFEAFLGLPAARRWAYLDGRADLLGTLATMAALGAATPPRIGARLVAAGLPSGPVRAVLDRGARRSNTGREIGRGERTG